jgi:hypothetical protein
MSKELQIAKRIQKGIEEKGFVKIGKSRCKNEEQTKQFLILPFMELLGYSHMDIEPEYEAGYKGGKDKRVDYAIKLTNREPEIIIECKKYGENLDRHTNQLNDYFLNTSNSKIGVLTNGIEYRFYASKERHPVMHNNPFFTFEINDNDQSALKDLARYHKDIINVQEIVEEANEIIFLSQFNDAMFLELSNPSRSFTKNIYDKMGIGSRMSPEMEEKIASMINLHSFKEAIDRMVAERAAKGNIITTKEELNAYNIIRTLLVQSSKISSDRINYRDQKTQFSILVDNNRRKNICDLKISSKGKFISLGEVKTSFQNVDDLVKLKKKLVDRALKFIE